jgi:hypothetical protein
VARLNTRLKDYFHLYVPATELPLETAVLSRQFVETFERRGTVIIPQEPVGLSVPFANDSQRNARWAAFLNRSGASTSVPASFQDVVEKIRAFVLPPFQEAAGSPSRRSPS